MLPGEEKKAEIKGIVAETPGAAAQVGRSAGRLPGIREETV